MDMDALVLAHTQRRGVDKTDAGAFSQEYLLDKDGERYDRLLLQLHEAVVGDDPAGTGGEGSRRPHSGRNASGNGSQNCGTVS